jgi:hypothetical protein
MTGRLAGEGEERIHMYRTLKFYLYLSTSHCGSSLLAHLIVLRMSISKEEMPANVSSPSYILFAV